MSVIFLRAFYHIFPTRLRRNYQADHCSLEVSSRSSGNDCVCVVLGLKWSYIAINLSVVLPEIRYLAQI